MEDNIIYLEMTRVELEEKVKQAPSYLSRCMAEIDLIKVNRKIKEMTHETDKRVRTRRDNKSDTTIKTDREESSSSI